MGKPLALLKVSALMAIAPLGACATPTDTDSKFSALPEFREPAVAVFDDGKQALFKAERSYTLSLAGNEEGRVYQALDGMVRITAAAPRCCTKALTRKRARLGTANEKSHSRFSS